MSRISTYEVVPVPKLADKLIGTSVGGEIEDVTYNFTLQELLNLFIPFIPANNLQGVLNFGNTATQDINLFGTITTTNLDVTNTSNLFITYLNDEVHIVGSLFDSNDFVGTAGQVLISTGAGVEWYSLPPIFTPNLQQVLTEGNTSTVDIILTSNLSALDVSSDTATFSTDITIDGTLTDGTASVGTLGKVLSSTVTGVQWVDLPSYSAISPLFFNSITGVFSIQVANSTQNGYLSSTDWINFDGKQNAGNYITALTGEATATGPGSVAITLSNTAVIGKILTGLSVTGAAITATDTILQAFGKAQNQINGKQDAITLTTTGTSGPATLLGSTLNIPNYADGGVLSLSAIGSTPNANAATITGTVLNLQPADAFFGGVVTTGTQSFAGNKFFGGTVTFGTGSTTAIDGSNGRVVLDKLRVYNAVPATQYHDISSSATSNYTLTIPNFGGTMILDAGTQTMTGAKTFSASPSLGSTAGDLFWTSINSSPTQRRGLFMADGATINMQIYTGGNSTLGAFTEGVQTLVIGTGVAGGGGSGEKILFHSTGRGNMFAIDAATQVNTSYFSLNAAAGLTGTTANFTGQLTLGSTITNGTYTYTLPSATGTLALVGGVGVGTVTSVGLSMPAAFSVASSPITSSGTIAVTGAGLASQYIRGDGQLADFPTGGGGGGSSVSYYLNGSVNQGTFGGNTYYEMNKVPILGAGTDFTISSNGYIAQFLTDANDPNSLLIPAGNWNFETYFSASSGGGSPSFYVELYKFDGTTFTLIASNSATPELISFGTSIQPYFSALAVPETVLLATDRLAVRIFVNNSSRTITLHTEGAHLCQVITTFTTGLQALNGLTKQTQYLAVGTSGTDFAISSSVDTHTFNLPTASATNRGALSSANWSTFNNKQNAITLTTTGSSGSSTFIADVLNVPTYTLSGLGGVPTSRTITINGTSQDLSADRTYNVGTVTSVAALTLGTSGTDLSSTVANSTTTPVITLNVPTASATNRGVLSSADWTTFNSKQDTITLTTTGTSGAATFIGNTLNIPQYQSVLTNPVTGTGTTNFLPKFTAASAIGDSAITDDGTTVTLVSRALSGTSATFSSSVTVGGSGSTIGNYLKVLGSTANNANYPNIQLVGGTEVNNYPFISLGNGGVNLTIGAGYHTVNYPQRAQIAMDAVNYGISLQTSPSGSPIDRLIVTSGGNVLIGTTTDAGYKLDVNGTGRFSGALTGTSATFSGLNDFINNTAASTTTKFIRIGNTSGDMAIGVEGSTPTQISVADGGISYSTVLKTVGTTSLILGTLSKAALTINTSQQVTLAQALTGTSATFSSGIISTAPSSAIGLELRARSADDFSQMNFTNNAGSNINGSIGVEKVGTNGGLMYFYTKPDGGTIAERMRITSGGDLQLASGVATFNRSGKKIELNANVSNLNVDAEIEITSGMNLFFKLGGSERMRITSGGNVLIGSSTDGGQKFQVAGNMINNVGNNVLVHRVTGATTGYIYGYWTNTSGSLLYGVEGSTAAQLQTGSSPWDAVITTAQANGLSIGVNQVQFMRITSGRQAYISGTGNALNITSDNNTLSLGLGYQGTYSGYLGGFGSALYGYSTNGGYVLLNSSSVWVAASDAKRKRNFETYSNGLSAILGLQPKLYNMDFQKDGDEKQVGLVAQEVKDFIPKAYEDNNNFIGLNYNAIIVTMVNAIKELKAEIDILKNN